MILISHRGNIDGINPKLENDPMYIKMALTMGYHVEIDVWYSNEQWYLGHDLPTFPIDESFLENDKLWCHSKNHYAMEKMLHNHLIHCFWHENDQLTLTSKRFVWTYMGKNQIANSIAVLPEKFPFREISPNVVGICSDNIKNYKGNDITHLRNPSRIYKGSSNNGGDDQKANEIQDSFHRPTQGPAI
jgi:hypothetical protein